MADRNGKCGGCAVRADQSLHCWMTVQVRAIEPHRANEFAPKSFGLTLYRASFGLVDRDPRGDVLVAAARADFHEGMSVAGGCTDRVSDGSEGNDEPLIHEVSGFDRQGNAINVGQSAVPTVVFSGPDPTQRVCSARVVAR